MIRLYSVLDADGVKINTITADDKLIGSDWYPGYGAYLVDEGENPADPLPAPPAVKPDTWDKVLTASVKMSTGDRLDVKTGEVTKAEAVVAVADVIEAIR